MSEPTKNTRVKDEVHSHDNSQWGFSNEMNQFVTKLQDKFPTIRITSGKRDGNQHSHHHTGNAVDIGVNRSTDTDAMKMYDWLMNTEEGLGLMSEYGLGIIDETDPEMMKKTGATGPHFHIGPDSKFSKVTNERYLQFDSYYTYEGRKDAKYKKVAVTEKDRFGKEKVVNKWKINLGDETNNEYIDIVDPTGHRGETLDKNATEVKVVPPPVHAYYSKHPGTNYTNTYGEHTDSDLNLDHYAPGSGTGFQIGTPEFNFIQDVIKENERLKAKDEKTKESDARKRLEEQRKLKEAQEKQRKDFILDAVSSLKPYESEGAGRQPRSVDMPPPATPQVSLQSYSQLPNLPGISRMPQFIEGENPKFEEGGDYSQLFKR